MICPKCSNAVADDEMFCKNCGAALKKSKKEFVINIPEEEKTEPRLEEVSEAAAEASENVEPVNSGETEAVLVDDNEETEADTVTEQGSFELQGELELSHPQQENVTIPHQPHPRDNIKHKKNDPRKKTYLAIKLIASFCAIAIVILTALSAMTDIFEYNPNKTVVLSGLSSEQKESFVEYASKLKALYEGGYNYQTAVFDDMLELMKPDSENGLYAAFFEKKQPVTQESDPADRFKIDENNYSYCKVDGKDIERIAESLNLKAYHDANNVEYYYYDGSYYFSANSDDKAQNKLTLKVDDAKQTQSGDYYVTCGLYPERAVDDDGTVTGEPESKQYFLASLTVKDESNNWTVHEISDEPIIVSQSVNIKDKDNDKDGEETPAEIKSLDFEMKHETVTVKTSSGEVYAEYIVEYPYFKSTGITQTAINNIYSELVDSYKSQSEDADKLYEDYIKDGYDKDDLPLYTHIVSNVAYNDKGYISLLERKVERTPESANDEEATSTSSYSSVSSTTEPQSEQDKVTLAKTTYEGYTYVIESDDFVKKDEVLGKDYQQMYKTLYEFYYNSKHENASDEEETTTASNSWGSSSTSTIPDDTQGIGEAIYSSAWLLTEKGVLFCYQNEDNALDKVVLPYDKIDNMTIKLD